MGNNCLGDAGDCILIRETAIRATETAACILLAVRGGILPLQNPGFSQTSIIQGYWTNALIMIVFC